MAGQYDVPAEIIGGIFAVAAIGVGIYFIRRFVKKKKEENANKLIKDFPPAPSVKAASFQKINQDGVDNVFSVYDSKALRLNSAGDSIVKTLRNELNATFHTNDDVILNALSQLRTKSDFAAIQDYYDETASIYDGGKGIHLLSKMAMEMATDKNAHGLRIIDKLPTTYKKS